MLNVCLPCARDFCIESGALYGQNGQTVANLSRGRAETLGLLATWEAIKRGHYWPSPADVLNFFIVLSPALATAVLVTTAIVLQSGGNFPGDVVAFGAFVTVVATAGAGYPQSWTGENPEAPKGFSLSPGATCDNCGMYGHPPPQKQLVAPPTANHKRTDEWIFLEGH